MNLFAIITVWIFALWLTFGVKLFSLVDWKTELEDFVNLFKRKELK